MLLANQIEGIAKSPAPILTVYLNTRSQNSSRHPRKPAHLEWFRKEAAALAATLSLQERKLFAKEADRVEEFLDQRRPEKRALAIFAGRKTWTIVPLQVSIENELRWGKPAVGQIFHLLTGHPPYGVIALDHQGARFFVYHLGELTMLDEKAIDIDKSEWKKKELGHVTGEGVQKTRGSNREVYEHRLEAQYEHVCHEAAEEAERLWKQFEFAGLFLVGPDRLVGLIKSKIAQPFSPLVFSDPEDLGKFSPQAILRRLEPLVSKIEQKRQMAVVEQLLGDEGKLVVNPDEVFAQLQDGTIHTVVVASDGNLTLRECVKCGLASRSADPACSGCGGELRNVSLLEILPGLAATHHIKVEFVSGEAAKLLAKAGGIGGWSRQPSLRAAG